MTVTVEADDPTQTIRVNRDSPHEVIATHFDGDVSRGWMYLPPALAGALGRELSGLELVRTEHRVVYPQNITADSATASRVLDEDDAPAFADFINRRLAAAGLPTTAVVEARQVYAGPWRTAHD